MSRLKNETLQIATEEFYRIGNNGIVRPLTSTLESGSAAKIEINNAPLSETTLNEIGRLSRSGTIVTYTTGEGSPMLKKLAERLAQKATLIETKSSQVHYEGYTENLTTVTYKIN